MEITLQYASKHLHQAIATQIPLTNYCRVLWEWIKDIDMHHSCHFTIMKKPWLTMSGSIN